MLKTITDASDPSLPAIRQLYEDSFPQHQRREWDKLMRMLPLPDMRLEQLTKDDALVGFVITWLLDHYLYIEHFAVLPAHRGRHYGSTAIAGLQERHTGPLVLEAELPATPIARRRAAFYEGLGFCSAPYPYLQPPYRQNEPTHQLQLMTTEDLGDQSDFERMAALIRERVYVAFW